MLIPATGRPRKSGEEPSHTAQAEMPLFQYCCRPPMRSFLAAAPVATITASASTTRASVSSRNGGPPASCTRDTVSVNIFVP